jgi:hypothetical protein
MTLNVAHRFGPKRKAMEEAVGTIIGGAEHSEDLHNAGKIRSSPKTGLSES